MTKDTEIAVRRAIANGVPAEQISAEYGVHLKRVQAWIKDAEKDLATWRWIGEGRKAA